MGLDLSLVATGYAIWRYSAPDTQPFPIKTDVIHNKLYGLDRIEHIRSVIDYEAPRHKDAVIFIENFAYGAQGNAVYEIGMLHGVIRYFLWQEKIRFYTVSPTSIKKFVTGNGIAKKELMIMNVYKRYGFESPDNNVADAYSLMMFGLAVENRYPWELLSFEAEAIQKFRQSLIQKER